MAKHYSLATTAGLGLLLIACPQPAWSHDALAGWAYDLECCAGRDCAIEEGEVSTTPRGWFLKRTGNTVVYGSHKIRESKDGEFHSCWLANRRDDPGALLCIYVPPQNY